MASKRLGGQLERLDSFPLSSEMWPLCLQFVLVPVFRCYRWDFLLWFNGLARLLFETNQWELNQRYQSKSKAELHRGSTLASHSAAPGSIHGVSKNISLDVAVIYSASKGQTGNWIKLEKTKFLKYFSLWYTLTVSHHYRKLFKVTKSAYVSLLKISEPTMDVRGKPQAFNSY